MQVLETVQVAATPHRVWQVLVDVEQWPTWTGSVRAVRLLDPGTLAEGSRVELSQPRLPKAGWVVTELVEGRSFTWSSRAPGVVSTAEHRLEDTDGGTRVTLRLIQEGPLAGVLSVLAGARARRYVAMEAAGLRRRCEQPAEGSAGAG